MVSCWTRALSGALVLVLVGGACQDAPLGPRAPAARSPEESAVAPSSALSGRSSDSLVDVVTAAWSRLGHPEYRQAIDAWRRRELHTTQTSTLKDAPDWRATAFSALLTDGGDGTVPKAPPSIISHQEAMLFGTSASGVITPDVLEGEMTFVGDQGKIAVGTFHITTTTGASSTVSGQVAFGPGQVVYCVQIVLGSCIYARRLAGSLSLPSMPNCNASASGNLAYDAQNVQSTSVSTLPGTTANTGGTVTDDFSLSANLGAVAPVCPDPPADTTQTPTDPVGNPSDPYPPPTDPGSVPDDPAPPPAGAPDDYNCYTFINYLLLAVTIVCYPA